MKGHSLSCFIVSLSSSSWRNTEAMRKKRGLKDYGSFPKREVGWWYVSISVNSSASNPHQDDISFILPLFTLIASSAWKRRSRSRKNSKETKGKETKTLFLFLHVLQVIAISFTLFHVCFNTWQPLSLLPSHRLSFVKERAGHMQRLKVSHERHLFWVREKSFIGERLSSHTPFKTTLSISALDTHRFAFSLSIKMMIVVVHSLWIDGVATCQACLVLLCYSCAVQLTLSWKDPSKFQRWIRHGRHLHPLSAPFEINKGFTNQNVTDSKKDSKWLNQQREKERDIATLQ